MTALSTEARQLVHSAFAAAGIANYAAPPTVPQPGQVIVLPDLPWLDIERIGTRLNYVVRLRILVLVDSRSNAGAQVDAEDRVEAILSALPAAFRVTYVGPPQMVDIGGQGSILAVEISTQVSMKE